MRHEFFDGVLWKALAWQAADWRSCLLGLPATHCIEAHWSKCSRILQEARCRLMSCGKKPGTCNQKFE